MKFCPHCGYEMLPNKRTILCMGCSQFELIIERMRRVNPDHKANPLALLNPGTLLPLKDQTNV